MIANDAKSSDTIKALFSFVSKCHDKNRADLALAVLGQAVSADPTVPDFYVARADVYCQKRDLRRAKRDLDEADRLRPEYPGLKDRLDSIRTQLED